MVSGLLKRLPVKSVLGSTDIAQAILDCTREIDEHEQDYIVGRLRYRLCSVNQFHFQVLSVMRMEYNMQAFLDNPGRLPGSVQEDKVFVTVATGRRYELLVHQCQSREVSCVHQT